MFIVVSFFGYFLDVCYDICVFGEFLYTVGKGDDFVAETRFAQIL